METLVLTEKQRELMDFIFKDKKVQRATVKANNAKETTIAFECGAAIVVKSLGIKAGGEFGIVNQNNGYVYDGITKGKKSKESKVTPDGKTGASLKDLNKTMSTSSKAMF